VVELELLDKEIMVEAVAKEPVTVVLEAEVLEAAEAGVLLLVVKGHPILHLLAQVVPVCIIIIELVRIFLMLVVAEAQAVVIRQVQLLVELAVAVLVQLEQKILAVAVESVIL
jgi:hypothetical protein